MRILIQKVNLIIFLVGIVVSSHAESITSLVEFFSFRCSHCANVNQRVANYVATHPVEFMDVNVDATENAIPTTIMYYVAIDAGIGQQFKTAYFAAVASGMPAYTPQMLSYVTNQVKTPTLTALLKSDAEKQKVKTRLMAANQLLSSYRIQATPTFLINQAILLEGENIIDTLR